MLHLVNVLNRADIPPAYSALNGDKHGARQTRTLGRFCIVFITLVIL